MVRNTANRGVWKAPIGVDAVLNGVPDPRYHLAGAVFDNAAMESWNSTLKTEHNNPKADFFHVTTGINLGF